MTTDRIGRGGWRLPRLMPVGVALMAALAGCDADRLLDIDDPEFPGAGQIPPAAVAGGATAELQRAYSGAQSDFHNEGYLSVSAALADEFIAAGTFTTRRAIDSRQPQPPAQNNISDWAYRWLHRARRAARDAIEEVEEAGTIGGADLARLHSIEAYAYVALGEGFCGAVPISNVEDGVFQHGPMLSTTELFEAAVERFDRALAADGGNRLAAVGKGRALLNMGRFGDAAAAVAGVPTSFAFFFDHSNEDSFLQNNVAGLQDNGRWSVADEEGGTGMPFLSAGDPRTPWVRLSGRQGMGFDETIPLYQSQRYRITESAAANNAQNVVLADGIEARLIQAEAALNEGGDWLGILNELRADFAPLMSARYGNYEDNLAAGVEAGRLEPALPPLTDPGTTAGRVDLLFRERAFWLYLTGHRLGDLRRLARAPYNRPVSSVFPTGAHHMGGSYGNAVAFPIPFDEENNINYDPSACDITQP